MTMMLTLPTTCSTREAAKRLNVALSTVQVWVETGALEAWKTPGGHRRVTVESVDRLLAKGMTANQQRSSPPVTVPDSTPRLMRILVVEDEDAVRSIYEAVIESWDLPVSLELSNNGYDALLRVGYEIPDLIITDLNMPEMDGFKMIQALRNFKATAAIQIVVVTGLSDADIADDGGLPDGVQLLHKPIDFNQLKAMTLDALSRLGSIRTST
jgi:excisionase family DNA binding protein